MMSDSQGSRDGDFSPGYSSVQQKSSKPESSCVCMKSDCSMDPPLKFKSGDKWPDLSSNPESSCVSMKSDCSMDPPLKFKSGETHTDLSSVQQKSSNPESSCVSVKSDCSMDPPLKFKSGDKRPNLSFKTSSVQQKKPKLESNCVSMKSDWSMTEPPQCKRGDKQPDVRSNLLSRPVKTKTLFTPVIQPTYFNESMNPGFSHDSKPAEVLNKLRSNLRKKFECLYEGISKQGNPTLLNEIYTELYITESESGEISNEHEVRQIETQSRRAETEDTQIKCSDIFRPLPGQDKHIRTVLTKGVAGIGKTVSVQKFILDWADGKENQDVQLIFPLPFKELNLMKDKTLSLSDLLHVFFPETKEMEISSDRYKVLFIFDGLDECRLSLDFQSDVRLCDVTESASVDELLMNLIAGNLLPSALIWITSRPAAADLVPFECVHRVTEVRGFSEPQKEEYFRKRISDQRLAGQIISHLKSSRSLFIMCKIPVFCWISATVLEKMMRTSWKRRKLPKTLTQMYTHFLNIQTIIKHEKDYEKNVKHEDIILKLGKLAYQQLVKGHLIFYEEDLRECGIDVTEASVYSGLCTQIFREELGLYQGKVFSFVHLSIQEHLAALYVHLSFINKNINVFDQITKPTNGDKVSLSDLHQRAVDEALDSKNGHLDLFLRFLLGLSMETDQSLLQELMTQTGNRSHNNQKTVNYIKEKISENPSPDKYINLFHCLDELGDLSLVNKAKPHMSNGGLRKVKLSSSQWSAIVFVLLTSKQTMQEFNLNSLIGKEKYYVNQKAQNTADEVLQKLLPVVTATRSAQLIDCGLTNEGCAALASALRSKPSDLRELSLSENKIRDSGVKLLSAGLDNPHCKLEELGLRECGVTDEGCDALASALRSNHSHLRYLNLSYNTLGDPGMKLLSAGLENPHCKLEELKFSDSGVTDKGCADLASALRSNPSHLRKLNLSENDIGDSGVTLLSAALENPHCKLEELRLSNCDVTDVGCAALALALRSNPSHLRYLDLTVNNLGDSGVKLLSAGLENPHCKMETLRLMDCDVTDEGCAALASALRANPLHLRKLALSKNKIRDIGVKQLSDLLKNPQCKLEELWLRKCDVTDVGCFALASALRSNPSHLRKLDLDRNDLGDPGMRLLYDLQENPHYKLKILWTE
ncbi:NACHT, LRR and PYD domains-containing protein 3-like isoform X2 [Chanodichthys erythropterus]|uniref:NACHT, LRR and PYD domains-containing protein 3-like isoform X2 n=1 Tax=Chanodichthys erythropterus TaxID=933992 RepID=UPI00351ED309